MKRAFDVVFSLVGLLILFPLLVVLGALVALTSPGGALFRQRRIGLGGREFLLLKFRSMRADAAQVGSYQTAVGDPRITRVGRFLRKTSLDELPQLWNVLRGDMSLIGPRPDVPQQRSTYTAEEWEERHRVRPGITGLAQATLRSAATHEQRKDLDLTYVRTRSLGLDLKILFMTVKQVLFRGSY